MELHKINQAPHKQAFWETFTAAPHRMMFFTGAIQLILPILFWCVELIGRYTDLWTPLDVVIPTSWAHGFLMIYSLFIFFIYGFLMTTYPRWMNGPLVGRDMYISTWAWLSIGVLVIEIGLFSSLSLLATGLGIFLFGWALGQWSLYQVYRSAPAQNKSYERILNLALLCGWFSASGFLLWILTDDWNYVNFSLKAGIWLFLLPVLFTVSHRMLPFFSSNVIRDYRIVQPGWSIPVFVAGCVGHLLLELNYLQQWLFLADLPLALLAWYHSLSWSLLKSFQDRLLAVLHIAFLWLAIGMSLYSLQSIYLLSSGELILGRGPLHALTIGFVTAMLIAMASRVSLGHSGRQLIADNITWLIFLGLQATAVLRIMAEINPLNSLLGLSLNVIAALLWLLVLGSWVLRYGPIYLSSRIDGRPG